MAYNSLCWLEITTLVDGEGFRSAPSDAPLFLEQPRLFGEQPRQPWQPRLFFEQPRQPRQPWLFGEQRRLL